MGAARREGLHDLAAALVLRRGPCRRAHAVTVGGEPADQADVLTYRDGKLVKFQTAGDTALLELVFGSK